MFGLIRKSQIAEHIKRAERRGSKKTAKKYKTVVRKKNDEIRKLKQYVVKVQKGFMIYRERRDGYRQVSEEMQQRLHEFQNRINRAIGNLRGSLDEVEYKVYTDSGTDKKVIKYIK